MPFGPKIGRYHDAAPRAEVLGTVKESLTDPTPQGSTYVGGTVDVTEPPPPWETDEACELTLSDARRFVKVPDTWELRWINPRLLESLGWRYWQPVMKSDPQVTVYSDTMVSPEGNVRRGGHTGDILAWMYKSWVEARRIEQQRMTRELAQSAVERQEQLKDDFKRGKYGPHVRLDGAKHPTHTMGDGQSMVD